ncbi:MAG TPA: ATPase, T2SS/T4P/T4SS family, partial [Bacteroidota bacterium]
MDKEAKTIDLTSLSIAPDVLALISGQTAFEMNALPISAGNGTITVALQEKYNNETVNDLAFLLGKKINVVTVPDEALSEAITRWYNLADAKRRQISVSHSEVKSVREEERLSEGSADGSVIPLANKIISDAISLGASDIHIEPYDKTLRVRFRLDGFLHEMLHPPSNQSKALISRLKIMADLDIAEKRRPQDGRIRVREGDRVIDIRVSSLPTDFGEKLVLRILDKSRLQLNLEALGFEEGDLQVFRKTIRLPYGMILVTGPTGSGKTTTLYAALNAINHPEINITTIEDPIEYNLTGINQTHVRPDIGVSFASALRAILRQDPNVIMVGEIRDGETAEIAIRAALTGHLVFSTLHTNDA